LKRNGARDGERRLVVNPNRCVLRRHVDHAQADFEVLRPIVTSDGRKTSVAPKGLQLISQRVSQQQRQIRGLTEGVGESNMSTESEYSIHTDVKFKPLELIDIRKLHEACKEDWFNQTLCQV
jgi:hypothetical protein